MLAGGGLVVSSYILLVSVSAILFLINLIVGKRYQHYWLEKGGKRKLFKNFKQFMNIYPKQKMALKQFIKENKLDIDNVEDVKMLCLYEESL